MRSKFTFALVVIVAFAIVGAGVSLIFSRFIDFSHTKGIETVAQKLGPAQQTGGSVTYNPPSPQDAPAAIRDAVILGYNIMMNTPKYAAANVGNKLSCTNCHFNGGITRGGKNGGISLVGVAATYPAYKKRQDYAVDLVTRTNDCFMRSMNGKPLRSDSREMTAIVTYYQWISNGLPIYAAIPWLGLEQVKSAAPPDVAKGKLTFANKCAVCHGNNGQGTQAGPALWGKDSFNDGAGMHEVKNFSAFSKSNMPKGNPDLSPGDSLDLAAFARTQPRPRFTRQLGSGETSSVPSPLLASAQASETDKTQSPNPGITSPKIPAFADRSKIPAAGKQGPPAEAATLVGNWKQGEALFAKNCQSCHGPKGTDKVPNPGSVDGTVPPLNPIDPELANKNPSTFAANIDRFIQHGSIPDGARPALFMPNWGDSQGLSQQIIADLEAYTMHLNGVQKTK